MKTFFKLLLLIVLVVYLGFAFCYFPHKVKGSVCSSVELAIADSSRAGFISEKEIDHLLKTAHLYPLGQMMDSVSSTRIEEFLEKNPFIKEVVCYKSPGGRINIIISQRLPVIRVMTNNGEDYYIDENGFTMKPGKYMTNLLVATGNIDNNFTKKHLIPIGRHIKESAFWNNQIEQVHVTEDKKLEIVPRVGNQIIYLGSPTNLEKKLGNLEIFYKKVMPTVGWNKYSRINLEFENQIICTKNKN